MFESAGISLNVATAHLVDCVALAIVLVAGRILYRITKGVNLHDQLAVKDNPAAGVALAAFILGAGIAISGGTWLTQDVISRIPMLLTTGGVAVVLMLLSLFANDKFILYKMNNSKEIFENRNVAVALVEVGSCIATGLMISGVFSMTALNDDIWTTIGFWSLYWLIGQVLLIVGAKLFSLFRFYDVQEEIRQNNAAVGVCFGGYIAALGFVTFAALSGAGHDVGDEIQTIGVFFAMGLLVLGIIGTLLKKALLSSADFDDEIGNQKNAGLATLMAVCYITIAVLFSSAISPANDSVKHEVLVAKVAPAVDEPATTVASTVADTKPADTTAAPKQATTK
jgi:uncharacterized membrane protein YjfL (UPF0719 family)